MNIPSDLFYTKDHEWISIEGSTGYIGVTDFAQGELGDIVFIEVETKGETLNKDEVFGTIEAVKTVSDLFLPVGGEIVEVNPDLENSPDLINKDPYGKGWIIKINIIDQEEIKGLLSDKDYLSLIGA